MPDTWVNRYLFGATYSTDTDTADLEFSVSSGFGIFLVRTSVDACNYTRGLYGHRKRVCTGSTLRETGQTVTITSQAHGGLYYHQDLLAATQHTSPFRTHTHDTPQALSVLLCCHCFEKWSNKVTAGASDRF